MIEFCVFAESDIFHRFLYGSIANLKRAVQNGKATEIKWFCIPIKNCLCWHTSMFIFLNIVTQTIYCLEHISRFIICILMHNFR